MRNNTSVIGLNEAASILKVDRETVRRWVIDGKIPSRRAPGGIRGAYMLERSDVVKIAAERAARHLSVAS